MIRTQLYLDEEIHRRLRELADQKGCTLSALIRDALVRTYGSGGREKLRKTLHAVEGIWRNRKDLGPTDEYVRRLRRSTRRKIRQP